MTDQELENLNNDIFYNTTLKVLEDHNKKILNSDKNNEEHKLPKYDIHLLDFDN